MRRAAPKRAARSAGNAAASSVVTRASQPRQKPWLHLRRSPGQQTRAGRPSGAGCLAVAVPPRFLAVRSIRARALAALPSGRRATMRRARRQAPPGPGSATGRSSRSGAGPAVAARRRGSPARAPAARIARRAAAQPVADDRVGASGPHRGQAAAPGRAWQRSARTIAPGVGTDRSGRSPPVPSVRTSPLNRAAGGSRRAWTRHATPLRRPGQPKLVASTIRTGRGAPRGARTTSPTRAPRTAASQGSARRSRWSSATSERSATPAAAARAAAALPHRCPAGTRACRRGPGPSAAAPRVKARRAAAGRPRARALRRSGRTRPAGARAGPTTPDRSAVLGSSPPDSANPSARLPQLSAHGTGYR